jgi:hypothetical protein
MEELWAEMLLGDTMAAKAARKTEQGRARCGCCDLQPIARNGTGCVGRCGGYQITGIVRRLPVEV